MQPQEPLWPKSVPLLDDGVNAGYQESPFTVHMNAQYRLLHTRYIQLLWYITSFLCTTFTPYMHGAVRCVKMQCMGFNKYSFYNNALQRPLHQRVQDLLIITTDRKVKKTLKYIKKHSNILHRKCQNDSGMEVQNACNTFTGCIMLPMQVLLTDFFKCLKMCTTGKISQHCTRNHF